MRFLFRLLFAIIVFPFFIIVVLDWLTGAEPTFKDSVNSIWEKY